MPLAFQYMYVLQCLSGLQYGIASSIEKCQYLPSLVDISEVFNIGGHHVAYILALHPSKANRQHFNAQRPVLSELMWTT
jgi:hypothetical protein